MIIAFSLGLATSALEDVDNTDVTDSNISSLDVEIAVTEA